MGVVTRTRLDQCATKGCPWPLDEDIHRPWCLGIPGVQHTREAQHQHVPKRSQGGKTVAAILCAYCHSKVDNTPDWDNKVIEFDDGERRYRLWDVKTGVVLIDREIGVSSDGGKEAKGGTGATRKLGRFVAGVASLPSSPDVSTPEHGTPHVEGGEERFGIPSSASPPPNIAESLKPNGLDLPDEFTFSDWTELAGVIAYRNRNKSWWAGDIVLAGERFGERATQYWNDLGYTFESLANCIRVCRAFPLPLRSGLSFAHHAVVYRQEDPQKWLAKAEAKRWTVKRLREEVFGVKPRTVKFTVDELCERAGAFHCNAHRNHGMRFLAAFLESLE